MRSEPETTRICARFVIGFADGDHTIIDDGEVVYRGERIVHVGHRSGADPHVDHDIDAGNAVVGPGFIDLDALADIDHALIDTSLPRGSSLGAGREWSSDYVDAGPQHVFDSSERMLVREFALRQLLRNGITTAMPIAAETHSEWAESYDDAMAIAEIAERIGLRMYLGPSYRSGVNVVARDGTPTIAWRPSLGESGLRDAVRFVEAISARDSDLLVGALLPCRIETLTSDLRRETGAAARRLGCLVRMHCLQSRTELHLLDEQYSSTPVQLLAEEGLLARNLLIPHAIHLGGLDSDAVTRAAELDLLAQAGVAVVHCPMTMARHAAVLDSFDAYLDAGLTMALGTDSFPPDLIRGMDVGTMLAKAVSGQVDAAGATEYFHAATLGGAAALQRDDLGRLAPGALADLIVIDLSDPMTGVVRDPIRTMLMNCSGRDVVRSVVHGRTVVADRRVVAPEPPALGSRAQELFDRMCRAYEGRDLLRRSTEELFPPSFPVLTRDQAIRRRE